MQLTNDINLLFWALGGLLLGLAIGVFISQWLGRASRAKADAELNELSATRLQLTTANGVLEQRLVGQQNQYEAQLKLLQDAKQTLGQEFENLANRIFEDKQAVILAIFASRSKMPTIKKMPIAIS